MGCRPRTKGNTCGIVSRPLSPPSFFVGWRSSAYPNTKGGFFMEILKGLLGQWSQILQVIFVLAVTTFILSKIKKNGKKFSTREIALSAMLMAISIVLTRVAAIMVPLGGYSALRLSFGPIPIMLASIMLGPILGAMVGAGADLLGMMIMSQGAFSPYIFLAQTLYGVIPFFVIYVVKNSTAITNFLSNKMSLVYSLAVVVTQLISGTITTYGLSILFQRPFGEFLVMRAPAQVIIIIGYAVIINLMYSKIYGLKNLTPISFSRSL